MTGETRRLGVERSVVNERVFTHLRFVAWSKPAGHFLRTETSRWSQSLVPADVEAQEVRSCAC